MNIKKNFMYSVFYQTLLIITPLFTIPYVSRILGAEGIGVYSYTYSIAYYCVLFTMLGVNNYGNRSVAMIRNDKLKLRKTFWSIYFLQVVMFLIVVVFYSVYTFFFVNEFQLIFFIQIFFLVSALFDVNWLFFGIEKFKLTVTRSSIVKVLSVIAIFIFVKSENDLWKYTLILSLSVLLNQLALWPYIIRNIKFIKVSSSEIFNHFKPNLVLFIPVIAVSFYKVINKIMLAQMSTFSQVGFYENAEKVISIPMGIITALGVVMLPRMSSIISQGEDKKASKYMENSMQFAMFMAIGMSFGIAGISNEFVPVFFGDSFEECIQLIRIFSPTIIFVCWANVIRTQYLIPRKKDKDYISSVITGAIVNVTINIILIANFGAMGTVIAALSTEITVAVYQTVVIKNDLDIKKYFLNAYPLLFFGLIMYGILRFIGSSGNGGTLLLIVQIFSGGAFYVFASLLFFICSKSTLLESTFLKKFIK